MTPSRTARRLRDYVVGLTLSVLALAIALSSREPDSFAVANVLIVGWLAYGTIKAARDLALARRVKRAHARAVRH